MTNITALDKQQLEAILKAHGVTKVSVFGSFARGEVTADSDLDLLVTYKPGTTLFDVIDLQDELEKALGRNVDLVSEKYIRPRLAKRIKQDLKPLSALV
jgi:predicted nucleotidyltransferase